jgi:hypothetical protein
MKNTFSVLLVTASIGLSVLNAFADSGVSAMKQSPRDLYPAGDLGPTQTNSCGDVLGTASTNALTAYNFAEVPPGCNVFFSCAAWTAGSGSQNTNTVAFVGSLDGKVPYSGTFASLSFTNIPAGTNRVCLALTNNPPVHFIGISSLGSSQTNKVQFDDKRLIFVPAF